jgi:nitroimidazol reductase NimA-like FMN-containing flavoprotein (pyridoxamine 5'-phosphate oxidase superfamily)
MASRREQIVMTPAEVDAFLGVARTLNVATIGPSGHPHLVAMWYGFLEGEIAFWTFAKSQKILNLRRSPLLSALAEEGTTYATLKGVELVGRGRIVEDRERILAIGMSVAERHNGPAGVSAEARPFLEAQAAKRVGVVIDVDKVVSWDHTKLGGAY